MIFGPVLTSDAIGHTLAHSLTLQGLRLPKGCVLTKHDVARLLDNGVTEVTVARFDTTDLDENEAAKDLAGELNSSRIRITEPFSGRVNLIATCNGVLRVNAAHITSFNQINEAITIATLPDYARVHDGSLLATIKIIPYGVANSAVLAAKSVVSTETLQLHPLQLKSATLILTTTPGFKPSLITKGEAAVRSRTTQLGLTLDTVKTVPHTQSAITAALSGSTTDITLILGASATSDRNDVAPAALIEAGGTLTRFGMPVDPGNLLFLGSLKNKPVVGLPGCARSPALNGADWVLERLVAGLPVPSQDIAAMGVGGLLKEVPARPQPRRRAAPKAGIPHILLLAAGKSSRMRGDNKLLREIDGQPLVARTVSRLKTANADMTIVINPQTKGIRSALANQSVPIIEAPDAASGLSASLRAGITALPPTATAVIIALADMPDITAADIDALIAAHNPDGGTLIVAPTAPNGKRGNPVLFDRRYFETLATLSGDTGAKALIEAESDMLKLVPRGAGVLVDLDTPEAWEAWQSDRANKLK